MTKVVEETPIDKDVNQVNNKIEDLELEEGMDVIQEKITFKNLLRKLRKGKIYVDREFQRDEIYRIVQKSALINSALSGISIPPLYAYEERLPDGGYVLSIIDGQQRISSIRDFLTNKYELIIPFGKYSILNGYTYEQICKLNPDLGEEIGELILNINVIRNIDKKQAQEYFGLINNSSMPLSPGEKLWAIHDPVKTILNEIVNNPYFKITNLRKTRKREYVIATKLLWNSMFNDPTKHEFVGDEIKRFVDYFNSMDNLELLEIAREEVLELLKLYSEIVELCQFSPRTQGDLYSVLCFLSVIKAQTDKIDVTKMATFLNWIFKGINKQIYPYKLQESFEYLSHNRVSQGHVNSKDFVITLEYLYSEEVKTWLK